jgi:hypothetical protein
MFLAGDCGRYEWAVGGGKDLWGGKVKYLFMVRVRDAEADPRNRNGSLAELLHGCSFAGRNDVAISVDQLEKVLNERSVSLSLSLSLARSLSPFLHAIGGQFPSFVGAIPNISGWYQTLRLTKTSL